MNNKENDHIIKLKKREDINPYIFFNNDIKNQFNMAMNGYESDIYLFIKEEEIVAFSVLMKEELECGFLHYHIPKEKRAYFSLHYPALDKKTNQLLYIYSVKEVRKVGIATTLLAYIIDDLRVRGYIFLWLKRETSSHIYEKMDFLDFFDILSQLGIDENTFLDDYQNICGYNKNRLLHFYGDKRVVKWLNI